MLLLMSMYWFYFSAKRSLRLRRASCTSLGKNEGLIVLITNKHKVVSIPSGMGRTAYQ